ncbi:phosphotriesterase-related protein-like isoform X2 [Acanthaster planci]|uniref:Phosphotriesterase-related protein-like isoform X2 n=1 Tax=Acanthaster planci TaxID=133434 RepID=A0A8B7YEY5_ACAPL|nr:phosphotriesterase-related protein-like isoform X2 [Acanthaster planci]
MVENLRGKVLTVLGPIDPADLGCILSHEHLHADFGCFYSEPITEEGREICRLPITMENLYWLRSNPYSWKENLFLKNEDEALIKELLYLKKNGCQSLVELTTLGLDRNVGYYTSSTHPPEMDRMSQEDVEKVMTTDIMQGADGSTGRCGVIGEIGCSWPLRDNERKILRATASVQSKLGCPVSIHPGLDPRSPEEAVRVLQETGAQVDKIVMDHLDRCFFTKESLLEFTELGTLLEFDFFGTEVAHCQFYPEIDFMNDGQRIQMIKSLVEEGMEDRVVISHDFHAKHQMMKYGGHGLSHINLHVLPKMRVRGLSQSVIDKFVTTNPQRWLAFK